MSVYEASFESPFRQCIREGYFPFLALGGAQLLRESLCLKKTKQKIQTEKVQSFVSLI